nr:MAG TPA: hypothetical protein [Caudoviricetes sp.]
MFPGIKYWVVFCILTCNVWRSNKRRILTRCPTWSYISIINRSCTR